MAPRRLRACGPAWLLGWLALTTCSTSSGEAGAGMLVDTLPNGAVRVRGPEGGVWGPDAAWTLRERVRLGSAGQAGPELFGEAWDVELDAMGRIYVLDRLAKEVRVFGRDGAFVRALGREGEGPGEFTNPFGLAWSGSGNLWVVDVSLSRYSVFDTAGAHVREYRRSVGGYSWPWPGRFVDAGLLYEASLTAEGDALMAFSPEEELVAVDSFPRAIALALGGDFWNLQDERGFGAIVGIPFGRRSEWALDGSATIWTGHSGTYAIARRSLSGDTLMVLERPSDAAPVSRAERAREIEDLGEYATHPKMDLSRIPATKPYFRRLLPADDGHLWVLREGEGDRWFFDVFRDDGAFLGAVELPLVPSLYPPPLIRGRSVLAVTADDLGVQYVVLFEIVPA